ncbi:MAG TPA: hypothetical protein VIU29_03460, partial [Candidatus Deferrimicrobiaceae bacterium]
MKKRKAGTDIEATLDAVAADHVPGQTARKPPIGSLVGKSRLSTGPVLKDKKGLLPALRGAVDTGPGQMEAETATASGDEA